jgi:hypothetical protein
MQLVLRGHVLLVQVQEKLLYNVKIVVNVVSAALKFQSNLFYYVRKMPSFSYQYVKFTYNI